MFGTFLVLVSVRPGQEKSRGEDGSETIFSSFVLYMVVVLWLLVTAKSDHS